ncbi:MAG: four helix bundle protein [Variibacter sp.]|nr:four helix bundle protein [Variibacter sp.]
MRVWNEAMDLAEQCYIETRAFPRAEMFGMTAQICRSAASVPASIAEGYGRSNTGNYVQFLRIAQGSLKELETHILLAERVGLLALRVRDALLERCESVGKMLRALIRSIERRSAAEVPRLPTAQARLPRRGRDG